MLATLLVTTVAINGAWVGVGPDVGYGTYSSSDTASESMSGLFYGGGLEGGYMFTPMFGAGLGVHYDIFNFSVDSTTSKTNSLVIPVYLRANFGGEDAAVGFFATLGADIEKQMSGTVEFGATSTDVPDSLLEMDYALAIGAGAGFAVGPVVLEPTARFRYNLTAGTSSDTVNSYTQWDVGLFLNITFPLMKSE